MNWNRVASAPCLLPHTHGKFFFSCRSICLLGVVALLNLQMLKGHEINQMDIYHHHQFTEPISVSVDLDRPTNQSQVESTCDAFIRRYMYFAGDFTYCELKHSRPFRMCGACISDYYLAKSTYNDLMHLDSLKKCRIQHTRSDRVQIIPTVQKNIEDIWMQSDCNTCFTNVSINHTEGVLHYDMYDRVLEFLIMYDNTTQCLNISNNLQEYKSQFSDNAEESPLCNKCRDQYTILSDLYNEIWSHADGNICVDMVDRINLTRIVWSLNNCSNRSGEPAAIIAIACAVGITPLLFYLGSKVTGREIKHKLVPQTRFGGNSTSGSSSSHARPGGYSVARRRVLSCFS